MRITNILRYIFISLISCILIACISSCASPETASPTQWKTELDVLQVTVNAQYTNPIFDRLFAQPQRMDNIMGTYDIAATFVTDNGQFIEALYETNNISDTLRLEDTGIVYGQRREVIVQEREQRATILDTTTIPPQEAVKIATQYHEDFYTEHISTIFIISVLRYEPRILHVSDTPVVWFVSLSVSAAEERFIWIDAVTGEIVSDMSNPFESYPDSP